MPKANIQFPLFALHTPVSLQVLVTNRETDRPLLPLFYSAEDATDFARRHNLNCIPSSPMSPKSLYELLVDPPGWPATIGFTIIFDPIDATIENARIFQRDALIQRMLRLRDTGR